MKPFLTFLLAACMCCGVDAQQAKKASTLLITGAHLVDVAGGKILSNRLLLVSGNRIEAVDAAANKGRYPADRTIDATGKYIIPGLWDMHVHFRGGDSLITANKALLPLFLAHGVTTVRDCGGDITPAVLQWRKDISEGRLAGPRIFSSGPKIDGPNPSWEGSLEVQTPAQVAKALDSLQGMQVDFVKLYDSKISREAFLETLTQAQRRGLKTSGHMPYSVTIREAADRGLDGSEHLYYIFKGCSTLEDSITALVQAREGTAQPFGLFAALPHLYRTFSEAKASELFRYLAQKGMTVLPTLHIGKVLMELKENDHVSDTMRAYIHPGIQATYAGRVNSARRQSDSAAAFRKQFEEKAFTLVPRMFAAGVNILAGSDCGAFNSFVYPGSSLLEEVKMMVAVGLTPAQALQTAILNGPKFMGVSGSYGAFKKGMSSDLVVLGANPLADINAIAGIQMVLSNGQLYTKKDLDALMQSVRRK